MRPDERPRDVAEFYLTASGKLHWNWCGQLRRASYPQAWRREWAQPLWADACRLCLAGEWPSA